MAEPHTKTWLALLVAGLVLAVCVIMYFVYSTRVDVVPASPEVNLEMRPPGMPQGPQMPDPPIPVPK